MLKMLWLPEAAGSTYAIDSVLGRVAYGRHPRAVVVLDGCMRKGHGVEGTATPEMPPPRIRNNVFTRSLLARGWTGPPRARRQPADVAVYSAGLGPGCVAQLPGTQFPALSYLLLGGLRGWADLDGNGNVSTVELLRHAVRTLRALSEHRHELAHGFAVRSLAVVASLMNSLLISWALRRGLQPHQRAMALRQRAQPNVNPRFAQLLWLFALEPRQINDCRDKRHGQHERNENP